MQEVISTVTSEKAEWYLHLDQPRKNVKKTKIANNWPKFEIFLKKTLFSPKIIAFNFLPEISFDFFHWSKNLFGLCLT